MIHVISRDLLRGLEDREAYNLAPNNKSVPGFDARSFEMGSLFDIVGHRCFVECALEI